MSKSACLLINSPLSQTRFYEPEEVKLELTLL